MFDRRSISLRAISLLVGDVFVIFASMALSHILRFGLWEGLDIFPEHYGIVFGACLVFVSVFFAAGLYEGRIIAVPKQTARMAFFGILISTSIIIVVFYAQYELYFGRGVLFIAASLVLSGVILLRFFYRLIVGHGFFAHTALIIGEGSDLDRVVRLLQRSEGVSTYKVCGIIKLSPTEATGFLKGVPVLGTLSRLREIVDAYDVHTVILAVSVPHDPVLLSRLRPLRYAGIRIMDFISLHEELDQSIPVDHINDEWLMHASMNSSRPIIRKVKRLLDISISLVGLILSAPLSLLSALAVRLDSPGPVIFRQRRCGLEGKTYTLFKFRTMREDAEQKTGAVWAGQNDPRVTRIGRFLRSSRLDEIPQLVNVLRGEMSLVGPRPERPEFVEQLKQSIPFYEERLLVPPGITGWAQVMYPYAASIEAAHFKLQFDIYYIKNANLVFDFGILLKTFKTILSGLSHSEDKATKKKKVLPQKSRPHHANSPDAV